MQGVLKKMFYKRNKQETYTWLSCAKVLPLPLELVIKISDYLFDKVPCSSCGFEEHVHSKEWCRTLQILSKYSQRFLVKRMNAENFI